MVEKLLTADEVAVIARTAPSTVRYWRSTGTGPPCFKLGRKYVYPESGVQAWIDDLRCGVRMPA